MTDAYPETQTTTQQEPAAQTPNGLPPVRILFVCTGNTCRSPMAEAIARRIIAAQPARYGHLQVSSAGLYCAGASPASFEAAQTAAAHGCDLSQFTARQITADLAADADYVFTMTHSHLALFRAQLPQYADRGFVLSAYACGDPGAPDVRDPYGGDRAVYEDCFAALEDYVSRVLERFAAQPKQPDSVS